MAKLALSTKRLQIDKANFTVVMAISVAAFVTFFSLVTCKALLSQRSYQAKVIGLREKARDQLNENVQAADKLKVAYKQFVESPENVIGGSATEQGLKGGDNARIILDALPGQYDFPALTTSLEKLLTGSNVKLNGITGTDDELAQAANKASSAPQPVEIPFSVSFTASYEGAKNMIGVFERSIRPIDIGRLAISASGNGNITVDATAKTYYQPAKSLDIKSEVVR